MHNNVKTDTTKIAFAWNTLLLKYTCNQHFTISFPVSINFSSVKTHIFSCWFYDFSIKKWNSFWIAYDLFVLVLWRFGVSNSNYVWDNTILIDVWKYENCNPGYLSTASQLPLYREIEDSSWAYICHSLAVKKCSWNIQFSKNLSLSPTKYIITIIKILETCRFYGAISHLFREFIFKQTNLLFGIFIFSPKINVYAKSHT